MAEYLAMAGPVEPDKSSLWIWICFFRLGYFDRTDLQLFAIFMAKKLVGPRCVQIVSKRLVSQISCSIVKCLVY